jgi:Signal transduction histidine kinase
VTWTVRREPQGQSLVLEWSETGVVVAPPDRRGFGSELIEEAVPYDLSGTGRLVFRPTGILCQIVVPLGEACA